MAIIYAYPIVVPQSTDLILGSVMIEDELVTRNFRVSDISSTGGGTVTSLTTTGTSGVSTLTGGTLNIPNYAESIDNTSKVIYVTESDLAAGATLEDRIATYVNTLNYNKEDIFADVWIEYSDVISSLTLSTTSVISNWSPNAVTNTGSTLTWDVTGDITPTSQNADVPTFDLSTNTGTVNMNVYNVYGLSYLRLYNLGLTSLDTTSATALASLDLNDNALTTLNLTQNINLTSLKVGYNSLTSLDLSQNVSLDYVFVSNNPNLLNVDISSCVNLTLLSAGEIGMTTINTSSNVLLTDLYVPSNSLTAIDLSTNINLYYLSIGGNNLSSIDLSSNPALEYLLINDNNLSTLDISNNTSLLRLSCQTNSFQDTVTNQILADLVANGVTDGVLHYRNNETGQGVTDRATLISRGWTIFNHAT